MSKSKVPDPSRPLPEMPTGSGARMYDKKIPESAKIKMQMASDILVATIKSGANAGTPEEVEQITIGCCVTSEMIFNRFNK